jgi:hypothetical protein
MAGAQVVAITSFMAAAAGEDVQVHAGDVYAAAHPLVKSHGELFAPRDSHEVTAAPATRRRKAKT